MNISKEIRSYNDYNFVNSPKLFNINLNPLQNLNQTSRSISYNAEIDGFHENERNVKPPTYQQFNRLENAFVDDSSTSFWVSLLYKSISVNFQVKTQEDNNNNNKKRRRNKAATNSFPLFKYV